MSKFKPNSRSTYRAGDGNRSSDTLTAGFRNTAIADSALEREGLAVVQNENTFEQEGAGNAFQSVGFAAALLFVFFRFSFVHEFIAAKLNFNTHIIILLGFVSYLCCILSGQMFRAFKDKSTWCWSAFAALMCLATFTSFWKGGSLPILSDFLQTVFPVVLVIPAMTLTRGQLKKMISAIGVACIATALLGTLNNDFKSGRMSIDAAGSDIQDPNDYAAHLILMMPALAYLALRPGRSFIWKAVGVVSMAMCFIQILSTGSRGGFVSLALTGIYIVFVGSKRVKMAILVGFPVLAMLIVPFVPKESLDRLSTIFSKSASGQDTEATDSSQARLALLQASWAATLEHPFLGVGPGTFMEYQANSAKDNGQRGMWHVSHNAYTQVSSECGLPALIFYISALGVTMMSLGKASKSSDGELAMLARFMSVMIVGFSVCVIFLSLAYNVHILVLSALTVSLRLRLMLDGTWTRDKESSGTLRAQTAIA